MIIAQTTAMLIITPYRAPYDCVLFVDCCSLTFERKGLTYMFVCPWIEHTHREYAENCSVTRPRHSIGQLKYWAELFDDHCSHRTLYAKQNNNRFHQEIRPSFSMAIGFKRFDEVQVNNTGQRIQIGRHRAQRRTKDTRNEHTGHPIQVSNYALNKSRY